MESTVSDYLLSNNDIERAMKEPTFFSPEHLARFLRACRDEVDRLNTRADTLLTANNEALTMRRGLEAKLAVQAKRMALLVDMVVRKDELLNKLNADLEATKRVCALVEAK